MVTVARIAQSFCVIFLIVHPSSKMIDDYHRVFSASASLEDLARARIVFCAEIFHELQRRGVLAAY